MLMHKTPTYEDIDSRFPALPKLKTNVRRAAFLGLPRFAYSILGYLEAARQRRHLLALDEHMLNDIGVSRRDALREANRPFWDLPLHLNSRQSE